MRSVVAVGGIGNVPAAVTDSGRQHAGEAADQVLHAQAAAGENGAFFAHCVLHLIEIGRVPFRSHCVAMDEAQRGRGVDAVAQTTAVAQTVEENVAEMAVRMGGTHLGADHIDGSRRVPFADVRVLDLVLVKLGQPQASSNLSDEAKSGSPETMST